MNTEVIKLDYVTHVAYYFKCVSNGVTMTSRCYANRRNTKRGYERFLKRIKMFGTDILKVKSYGKIYWYFTVAKYFDVYSVLSISYKTKKAATKAMNEFMKDFKKEELCIK